ncbi:MAG: putative helicase [Paenibacillus sp.]|nr:putative helicase [Paenibacillus sp.]
MPEALIREICRNNGWSEEPEQLPGMLASEPHIRQVAESLFDLERRVLALIVRRFGYSPFDWGMLVKAGQRELSGAALQVALIRLSRKGILFARAKSFGEPVYRLPEDSFVYWTRMLLASDEYGRLPDDLVDGITDTPYRPSAASQLFALLAYIAKEDVSVTQKGSVNKRHAGRLAALVGITDAELPPRRDGAAQYSIDFGAEAVNFLGESACSLALLAKTRDKLEVRQEELDDWLNLSERQMDIRMYELWKAWTAPADSWLQHAIILLEQLDEGGWMPLQRLVEQLAFVDAADHGQHDIPHMSSSSAGIDSQAAAYSRRLLDWISPLAAWGFAETGTDASNERLFRWVRKPIGEHSSESAGSSQPCLYVQPDFELIVPPDCPYRVRWELELFAERRSNEQMMIYRLTREAAVRAFAEGKGADHWLAFLHRHAIHGLPDNVAAAIAGWGEHYSRLKVETGTWLKFRDETTAQTICRDERIRALLDEQLGPTAWTVKTDMAAELQALLASSGYDSGFPFKRKASSAPSEPEEQPSSGSVPEKGLIYSKAAVKYYDREYNFPPIEDVYPGLQDIPPMWLKECRPYHASTQKAMIQKALEWKACLKLRKAQAETLFIPLRLDGIRDDWAVTGFESKREVRLQPEQWEEMQLILPGINDESRS